MASTKPAKGMRDFLPDDVRRREYVVGVIKEVYEAHGFEPLETPTVERIETLLGKYGEEGNQLIFRVMKRGASLHRALAKAPTEDSLADLGLRYDLTVPLARVVAEHQHLLPKFFKRYQIQPVWRADRPAHGRFREFYQCDVDVVGSDSLLAEADVMSAAAVALDRLGFDDARIRLNHRGVLFGLLEVAGVAEAQAMDALVAIDKLDKIGWDGVAEELAGRGIGQGAIDALRPLLDLTADSPEAMLDHLERALAGSAKGERALAQLRELLPLVQATAAGDRLDIDPYLARGLSYYTGPIFEIRSPALAGSLGGGGRYDELVGMFLGRDIPAVGFSLGLERLIVVMTERDMFPKTLAVPELMIAQLNAGSMRLAMALATELRAKGVRVDLYPEEGKLGKQFKYADSRGIRHVAILGPDEVDKGVVAIKNLTTGDQRDVPRGEVVGYIRGGQVGT